MLRKILSDILDFLSHGATLITGITMLTSAMSQKDSIGTTLCISFGFLILYYIYKSEKGFL